ncbi:hypothetical protein [Mangrovibrevibacter kandeliae]|uniref:hypothetical protein n=1 Tax=Mangrovibrevibacter kandeliae TaxID=2968473 RepID=UPI002117D53B|nr:hypothetical protein [Aurantimonas sp. CSK15Z-1]MCQ8782841.1 hypothetical protein [Aurantimonas sp. CSK15Z-1]
MNAISSATDGEPSLPTPKATPLAWNTRDFVFYAIVLFLAYSATLFFPYLLTDETWIVRPGTYSWTFRMGRPAFSAFIWISGQMQQTIGLDVIYVMRGSAILALAATAVILKRWFLDWGHDRVTAMWLPIVLLSLPGYQIVVADGTQLAVAILLTTCATVVLPRRREDIEPARPLIAALLYVAALLIYQQQVLLAFAMLAVPLLASSVDRRTIGYVIAVGCFVTAVSVAYFLVWRIIAIPDERYGPQAVQFPAPSIVLDFVSGRFIQAANLWKVVGPPQVGLPVVVVAILMAIKVAFEFFRQSWRFLLPSIVLVGLLVASDGFAILARNYPSYVTLTPLNFLIGYWAFAGLAVLAGRWRGPLAAILAVGGALLAFITVKDEIAIPNNRTVAAIRAAFVEHPQVTNFNFVLPVQGGPGYSEFGWRNTANYLYLMAINVADHLSIHHVMNQSWHDQLVVTTPNASSGDASQNSPRPDALTIELP